MYELLLTNGGVSLIDDEKYEAASKYNWCNVSYGRYSYARCTSHIYLDFLHHFVFGEKTPLDHINGNTLDNRLVNLRKASKSQNAANARKRQGTTSKYKGVHFNSRSRRWVAKIMVNYAEIYLGAFDNEEDAADAYAEAALKYFGEYARIVR